MKPDKMLREIVQRGVEKGWKYRTPDKKSKLSVLSFSINSLNRICVKTELGHHSCFSVADLIDNNKFMESVYGVRRICVFCKESPNAMFCRCALYTHCKTEVACERYKDVQRVAITLEGDEQIKYMYGRMER